jgi:hypothetical protein
MLDSFRSLLDSAYTIRFELIGSVRNRHDAFHERAVQSSPASCREATIAAFPRDFAMTDR